MNDRPNGRSSLVIGTRGSRLALWQAEWVRSQLVNFDPDLDVTLRRIQTSGDKILDVPLAKIGGKGLFVKEIEDALLNGDIDLAVHSMKDVPSILPEGLEIVCVPEREDPRDALVSRAGEPIDKLKKGARIGTSSLRRQAQLLHFREDFEIHILRGNLDTRLRKLREGQYDAIVLAAAGLNRMGWSEEITEYLSNEVSLPAIGQGALGLEGRRNDFFVKEFLKKLEHGTTRSTVKAERAFLRRLEGGCQVPIGGHGIIEGTQLTLEGLIASVDGKRYLRKQITGPAEQSDQLGVELAESLLAMGGGGNFTRDLWRGMTIEHEQVGKVFLVGAGPGDPKLLTLRGQECLRQAEVVLFDHLANPVLLDYVPPHAERIYVGRRGRGTYGNQRQINHLIVSKAREGKCVVRLKGGDPFVFGRGGEEAEVVAEAGLPFEVVPGVTSAVAVPAYAGIPVTHRMLASTVAFVTGHEDPTKPESALDWPRVASSEGTLVFLMGMKNLSNIVERLLREGKPPDTPVALIRWGTYARQHTVVGTLADILGRARSEEMDPPTVIVVGPVVELRARLNWFETRPLFGKRILVTRPRDQASDFSQILSAYGAELIECPTLEIIPPESWDQLDGAIEELKSYDWLIFTSVNGVRYFMDRLRVHKRDARALANVEIGCIGPKTAEETANYGLRPDLVPSEFQAEGLIEAMKKRGVTGRRILIPRAHVAREVLPEQLRAMGALVQVVTAYRAVPPKVAIDELKSRLRQGEIHYLTFASSSTFKNFCQMFESLEELKALTRDTTLACIGPITAQTVHEHGLHVGLVAPQNTIPALADTIAQHSQQLRT